MEIKKEVVVMEVANQIIEIYGKGRCSFKMESDGTGCLIAIIKDYKYTQGSEYQEHRDKILHRCRRLSAKKNKMHLKHFIVSMEGVFFYIEDVKNKKLEGLNV